MQGQLGITALVSLALLGSCSKTIDDGGSAQVDFSDPKKVLSSVFHAARSGETQHLASLCDPKGSANQHAARICSQVKDGPDWDSFVAAFAKASLVGEARITGNAAMLNFVFGTNGKESETMELVRRDGRWYLVAF